MRILVLLALAASGVGCYASPVAVSATNNDQVPVDTLFEHDGCTVYRFHDGSIPHYYARCSGSSPAAQTMTPVRCGKNCVRSEVVATYDSP
jgi:hypothetical protein